MNESFKHSIESEPHVLRETPPDYSFELPIAPDYREVPPSGSVDDGIELSLLALEQVKHRPEVFAQRERRRCNVEFRL